MKNAFDRDCTKDKNIMEKREGKKCQVRRAMIESKGDLAQASTSEEVPEEVILS